MQITDTKYYHISFDKYLKLPGYSYSGIRNQGSIITPTRKMIIGTKVHEYLLTPQKYTHDEDIDIIRPLAIELKKTLGSSIKLCQREISVTSRFSHEGFTMLYKGRIDLCIPRHLIIDIKISEMNIAKSIDYFGYNNQVSGYALSTNIKNGIIISINPKTKISKTTVIPIEQIWWQNQVKIYGTTN